MVSLQNVGLLLLIVSGAPIVVRTVRGALRGHFASDIVATLAIVTAIALRQPIAGLVIVQCAKAWFIDRMVLLFEDMKTRNPTYAGWEY